MPKAEYKTCVLRVGAMDKLWLKKNTRIYRLHTYSQQEAATRTTRSYHNTMIKPNKSKQNIVSKSLVPLSSLLARTHARKDKNTRKKMQQRRLYLLRYLEERIARHVLNPRVQLVHELEQFVHHGAKELPVRPEEARVLPDDVHDVGRHHRLVVLAPLHLAQVQQVLK